jgi:hypothetical protein
MEFSKDFVILDIKEVCALLKVSRPTLATLPIPSYKVGKRDKYLLSDITDYLKKNRKSHEHRLLEAEQKIDFRKKTKEKILRYREELYNEKKINVL